MNIKEGLPPRQKYESVAIDLEIFNARTKQLHRPYGDFACLSIASGDDVWVVTKQIDIEKALARVDKAEWVMHNGSFDLTHLRRWADISPRAGDRYWDTIVMERILWSGFFDDFGLADLSRRYLDLPMSKAVRKQIIAANALTPEMVQYAAWDAHITLRVRQAQELHVKDDEDCRKVWQEVDNPALWAILDFKGITLDSKRWLELSRENRALTEEIAGKLGFNPGSPKQVQVALAKRNIKLSSTAEEFLVPHRDDEVVADILRYREADKLAGTYGEEMLNDYLEDDGRIHGHFEVLKARTNRMAADSPNLQNIPRDKRYRACFTAPRGRRLAIGDVASQEPRFTAQVSKDPHLLDAFANGEDVHWTVTEAIYELPEGSPVNKEQRKDGKVINLGMVYGLTAWGVAKKTGKSEAACELLVSNYFKRMQKVQSWMADTRRDSGRSGIIRTLGGHRQFLNLYTRNWPNLAVNTPIQGSAAEQLKLALGYLHADYGSDLPIDMVVHDEVVAEAETPNIKKVAKAIEAAFIRASQRLTPDVSVRGLVDMHIGTNWSAKG